MSSPQELKIAVISDLHCHHSSQGPAKSFLLSDAERYPSNQHPVEALHSLAESENLQADILLVPGDLTNAVDIQGMISGWQFVQEIASLFKAKSTISTLGNHDVISRIPSQDAFLLAKRHCRPKFPSTDEVIYNQFWSKHFYAYEAPTFRVVSVNTVASHTNYESAKQGLVTRQQIDDICQYLDSSENKPIQIALCHHHPILHEDIRLGKSDVMENGSLLVDALNNRGFSLLVHGHKHHPKLSNYNDLPILASGSFSAGLTEGLASRTRNVFHLVTLELPTDKNIKVRGTIKTWQFQEWKGWVKANWLSSEFPYLTGFGCSESISDIVEKIQNTFESNGADFMRWRDAARSIDALQYLSPTNFEKVGNELKKRGLELQPAPPDEPQIIGIPQ